MSSNHLARVLPLASHVSQMPSYWPYNSYYWCSDKNARTLDAPMILTFCTKIRHFHGSTRKHLTLKNPPPPTQVSGLETRGTSKELQSPSYSPITRPSQQISIRLCYRTRHLHHLIALLGKNFSPINLFGEIHLVTIKINSFQHNYTVEPKHRSTRYIVSMRLGCKGAYYDRLMVHSMAVTLSPTHNGS